MWVKWIWLNLKAWLQIKTARFLQTNKNSRMVYGGIWCHRTHCDHCGSVISLINDKSIIWLLLCFLSFFHRSVMVSILDRLVPFHRDGSIMTSEMQSISMCVFLSDTVETEQSDWALNGKIQLVYNSGSFPQHCDIPLGWHVCLSVKFLNAIRYLENWWSHSSPWRMNSIHVLTLNVLTVRSWFLLNWKLLASAGASELNSK